MQHPRQGTRPAGSSLFRDFVRRTFCGLSARNKDSFIEKFRNFRRFPENLLDFINILQEELIEAKVLPQNYDFEIHKELVAMQPGDVPITYADTKQMEDDMNFKPSTSLREGLKKFAKWYKNYYMQ